MLTMLGDLLILLRAQFCSHEYKRVHCPNGYTFYQCAKCGRTRKSNNPPYFFLIMRKDKTINLSNGLIIGDSSYYGNNQCISGTLRFSVGFEDANQSIIEETMKYAKDNGFKNLRLVTCKYIALSIKTGIVSWIKVKESVKPFKL